MSINTANIIAKLLSTAINQNVTSPLEALKRSNASFKEMFDSEGTNHQRQAGFSPQGFQHNQFGFNPQGFQHSCSNSYAQHFGSTQPFGQPFNPNNGPTTQPIHRMRCLDCAHEFNVHCIGVIQCTRCNSMTVVTAAIEQPNSNPHQMPVSPMPVSIAPQTSWLFPAFNATIVPHIAASVYNPEILTNNFNSPEIIEAILELKEMHTAKESIVSTLLKHRYGYLLAEMYMRIFGREQIPTLTLNECAFVSPEYMLRRYEFNPVKSPSGLTDMRDEGPELDDDVIAYYASIQTLASPEIRTALIKEFAKRFDSGVYLKTMGVFNIRDTLVAKPIWIKIDLVDNEYSDTFGLNVKTEIVNFDEVEVNEIGATVIDILK